MGAGGGAKQLNPTLSFSICIFLFPLLIKMTFPALNEPFANIDFTEMSMP